jgi:hypothetical protein
MGERAAVNIPRRLRKVKELTSGGVRLPSKNSGGKHEYRLDQVEERIDRYSNKAKWKQEQPDNRIKYKCKKCQRPADDE